MKILFAASEAVPFAKTGGLADVAGSLPQALAQAGNEVCVVMPLYAKAPQDCTDEDYKAFYRKVFHDYKEPLFHIHINADYTT